MCIQRGLEEPFENMYICFPKRVISSVGSERCLDRAEVSSSSLLSPTIRSECVCGCESGIQSECACGEFGVSVRVGVRVKFGESVGEE